MSSQCGKHVPLTRPVELGALLAARDVCPVFQPIVDLGTGERPQPG